MKFKAFGLGGCGINIVGRYQKEGIFRDEISLLGLDTSDANMTTETNLTVEFVPGASGSGSDQSKNADKYDAFLKKIITQYEPGDVNILVYSASGGSGSSMGPTLHRALLDRGISVISIAIGDSTTITEATNTVGTLLNLNRHTETGSPVIFTYFENTRLDTHGGVNKNVIDFIDSLRVMLGSENKRIDRTDIHHLFFYNKIVKAVPVLSRLEIVSGDDAENYTSNAVAAISLYDNEDNIRPVFSQLLYRKAGIFGDQYAGSGYKSLHAVIDHGDSVRALKDMLDKQRRQNAEVNDHYQAPVSNIDLPTAPGGSTFVKFDI